MPDAPALPPKSQVSQSAWSAPTVLGLLALTAAVRLPGITRPLLGNFATKSVVYAMIARNWVEGRTSLWYPALDCLAGRARSLHMMEFPVSAYLTGWLWKLFGGSLDVWGRATSIVFCVASVAVMYAFVRRRHGPAAGLGAGLVLALSPVGIVYGQSFMLEASLVFFTVATFYSVDRWLDGRQPGWLLAAVVSLALLLLTKIYMAVLLLPLTWTVLESTRPGAGQPGREWPRRRVFATALLAAVLAIVPAALWYAHAVRTAAPSGARAAQIYFSLQRGAATHSPPDPLLWNPDFYRQILDDLTGVVLTPLGFALLLAGFLDRAWLRHAAWLAAMAILVAVLPRKFYEMNYYWMAVLAPLCVMAGLGWKRVWERLRPGRIAAAGLLLVALVLSIRYAFKPAFVTPEEDRAVVAAGRAVRELTAEQEPIVTMHGTGIDVLYYADRPGWAIDPGAPDLAATLEERRRQGARFSVMVGGEAASGGVKMLDGCECVGSGDGYRIWRLTQGSRGAQR